jgi:CRISPR type III-A-associated RAMP protein Csm5
MKLRLRTLSPLHIGTGEELTALEYLVYDKQFYRIDQDRLFALTRKLLPENGARALSAWVSEQFEAMNNTRDNKELSRLNEEMNAYRFFEQHRKGREFLQELQSEPGTPVLIDERTRNRHRNAAVLPLGQVRGAIKNGQRRPYLPGSSLKGSLRTALFFHYLTHYGDKGQIERSIREQLSKRARKERFGLPLSHAAFFCGTKDLHRNRLKEDDEKMDLLKLVRIPDAHLAAEQGAPPLQLAKINIYLVEKQQTKDRNQAASFEAAQQPQASYCEAIPSGQILETELDFDIEFLLQIKPHLREGGITVGDQVQWIGIEKKVKQLFGLDLQSLTEQNKAEKKAAVLQHLLDCWTTFARRQIAAQQKWLAHYRQNDAKDHFSSRIAQGMAPVFSREQKPLIRLGYATGFQGMTAILYFLEDTRLESLYKALLETFDIGNRPGNRGAYKVNMERFPKSRRLMEDGKLIRPLGWLECLGEGAPDPLEEESGTTLAPDVATSTPSAPPPPAEPDFFEGSLNHKKPPEMDAVVTVSGRPNKVKVYVRPDYMPELPLNGYASSLETGTVIVVRTVIKKTGEVVQVSFGRRK